jgi:predicted RNA methylase
MQKRIAHHMSNEAQEIADALRRDGVKRVAEFVREAHRRNVAIGRDDVLGFMDRGPAFEQYYTPDDVARFMASIGMSHRPRTVLDPAYGVGNLLFYCSDAGQIVGVDINNELTPAATLLCPRADFRHADFLNTDRDRSFDLVIVDPPFGLMDHSSKIPFEERMVRKSLECLAPDGLLVALVPPSLLWSQKSAAFREMVLRDYSLEAVVSLWPGALHTTGIASAVIVIRKQLQEPRIFVAVAGGPDDLGPLVTKLEHKDSSDTIDTSMLVGGWNPALLLLRQEESGSSIPYKQLSELAEVIPGAYLSDKQRRSQGDFLIFSPRHVQDGHLVAGSGEADYVDAETANRAHQCIAQPGDIVMYMRFTPGKVYFVRSEDPGCIIPSGFLIVRSDLSSYIRAFLSAVQNQELVLGKARARARGSVIKSLSVTDVESMRIPMLPLDNLNDLDPGQLRGKTAAEQADLLDGLVAIDLDYEHRVDLTTGQGTAIVCCDSTFSAQLHDPTIGSVERSYDPTALASLHQLLAIAVRPLLGELRIPGFGEGLAHDSVLEQAIARIEQHFEFIEGRLDRIESQVTAVHVDTGHILSQLSALQADFASIKSRACSIDEKLESLSTVAGQMLATVRKKTTDLSAYSVAAASLIPHWESMEPMSQSTMTMAEYLLEILGQHEGADYSPCILEYCKSLENELLTKVFQRFIDSLRTSPPNEDLRADLDTEINHRGEARLFAEAVQPCLLDNSPLRFTLGQMDYELRDACKNADRTTCQLRQSFRNYLASQHLATRLLDKSRLRDLGRLVNGYRNPCAHPASLDRDRAVGCRTLAPTQIEWVLTASAAQPSSSS